MHEGDNIMLRKEKRLWEGLKTGIETKEENELMGEIKKV